jgi:hypothetical protein
MRLYLLDILDICDSKSLDVFSTLQIILSKKWSVRYLILFFVMLYLGRLIEHIYHAWCQCYI